MRLEVVLGAGGGEAWGAGGGGYRAGGLGSLRGAETLRGGADGCEEREEGDEGLGVHGEEV